MLKKENPIKFPKISIVIPSFNKLNYIGKTLESIVSQKYPNLEVIVQDGGSTDGSVNVIKKYAKKYPQIIKWVSKKDKGQLDAINKGFKKATGDILTYINADDVYEKNAFKKVVETYLKNPEALWFAGRGKIINANDKEIAQWVTIYKNTLLNINNRFFLLIINYLMQPSVFLTKRALLLEKNFRGNKNYVMEYDYWLRLSKTELPIVIKDYLSKFRMCGTNISSVQSRQLLESDMQIIKKHTGNIFILTVHWINNHGRRIVAKII